MKGFSKELMRDRIISLGFLFNVLIVLLSIIFVLINLSSLPPYIPIFNQLPWGQERLGSSITIFLPVGFVIFFSIFNFFISSFIYSKSQIISRMLAVANVLISFLSFLLILRTVYLVT